MSDYSPVASSVRIPSRLLSGVAPVLVLLVSVLLVSEARADAAKLYTYTCNTASSGSSDPVIAVFDFGDYVIFRTLHHGGEQRTPGKTDVYDVDMGGTFQALRGLTLRKFGTNAWCLDKAVLTTPENKGLWVFDSDGLDDSHSPERGRSQLWLDDEPDDAPSPQVRFYDRQINVPSTRVAPALLFHVCDADNAGSSSALRIITKREMSTGVPVRDLLLTNELGLNGGGLLRNTWYGVAIEVDGNARELNSAYFDLTGNDGICIDQVYASAVSDGNLLALTRVLAERFWLDGDNPNVGTGRTVSLSATSAWAIGAGLNRPMGLPWLRDPKSLNAPSHPVIYETAGTLDGLCRATPSACEPGLSCQAGICRRDPLCATQDWIRHTPASDFAAGELVTAWAWCEDPRLIVGVASANGTYSKGIHVFHDGEYVGIERRGQDACSFKRAGFVYDATFQRVLSSSPLRFQMLAGVEHCGPGGGDEPQPLIVELGAQRTAEGKVELTFDMDGMTYMALPRDGDLRINYDYDTQDCNLFGGNCDWNRSNQTVWRDLGAGTLYLSNYGTSGADSRCTSVCSWSCFGDETFRVNASTKRYVRWYELYGASAWLPKVDMLRLDIHHVEPDGRKVASLPWLQVQGMNGFIEVDMDHSCDSSYFRSGERVDANEARLKLMLTLDL